MSVRNQNRMIVLGVCVFMLLVFGVNEGVGPVLDLLVRVGVGACTIVYAAGVMVASLPFAPFMHAGRRE